MLLSRFIWKGVMCCSQRITSSCLTNTRANGARTIIGPNVLGIESYKKRRAQFKFIDKNKEKKFWNHVSNKIEGKYSFNVKDFKALMYNIDGTEEDVALLHHVSLDLARTDTRHGFPHFNTEVMRTFYCLQQPHAALEYVRDSNLDITEVTAFMILEDMLYRNHMYEEVLEVFDKFQTTAIGNAQFSMMCVMPVLATNYKQNSESSCKNSLQLIKDAIMSGCYPTDRALALAAALAINFGKLTDAEELIILRKSPLLKNLEVLCLAKMGRINDVLSILRSVLSAERNNDNRRTSQRIIHEIMVEVGKCVNESTGEVNEKIQFETLRKIITENNMISKQGLEDMLLKPMDSKTDFFANGFN